MTTGSYTGWVRVPSLYGVVIDRCVDRMASTGDECARLFHGRGHCYPGFEHLTVDYFPPYLLVSVFRNNTVAIAPLVADLHAQLPRVEGVSVQRRDGRRTTTEVLLGTVPEEVVVREAGLNYAVRMLHNQNVGLFLDMAPSRRWVRDVAQDRSVLNLFAFTCGFSVAAIAGGAKAVVNNDMSRTVLEWGAHNHALNGQDLRDVRMLPHNLFKSWRKIRQWAPYDLVVVDPPTNQRGSFTAEKHYGQILKRLAGLCAPGALVLACLNSPFLGPEFLTSQMARWCPSATFQAFLPASDDFQDRHPERGLKQALFRL